MADNRISSSNNASFNPGIAEGPAPSPMSKSGPTSNVERNRIETAERDYAGRASGVGKEAIESEVQSLGEHQSLEVNCKANVALEGIAGKAEGKLKITHRDDGKYEVEVMSAFGAGVGSEHAKALVGVGAGTRFVVSTPEAAADIAQAIASLEVVSASSTTGLGPLVMAADAFTGTSRNAMERLSHYSGNLSAVKCELRGSLEAEFGPHGASKQYTGTKLDAKGEAQRSMEFEVDLEKGEACFVTRLEGKVEGEVNLDLSPAGALAEQLQNRFGARGEIKISGRIESRCHIPPELKARIASGELSGVELAKTLAALPTHQVVVAEGEVESKGAGMATGGVRVKLRGEFALDDKAPADIGKALVDAKWEFEAEAGVGAEMKLGGGAGGVEGSLMKWSATKHELGSFREVVERALHHFEEHEAMHASVAQARLGAALA